MPPISGPITAAMLQVVVMVASTRVRKRPVYRSFTSVID